MDCQHARETLDASRPERRDWSAPELRDAAAHAEECESCRRLLAERDRFDRQVAETLGRVQIPVGLQDRLLASLAATDVTAPAETPPPPTVRSRSTWRWLLTSAALMLVAIAAWRFSMQRSAPVSMDELFTSLGERLPAADAASQHPFDGTFNAPLPDAVWTEVIGSTAAHGLDFDARPGDDAAVYAFVSSRLEGLLVVIPRSRVANPPTEALPRRSNSRYLPQPEVAWTVGDYVYVCVLTRGRLEDLQREFYGSAA